MIIKKLVVGVAAFAGVALSGGVAKANYVCSTFLVPGSSVGGSYGYVSVQIWSQHSCTGSYIGVYSLCSTGATSSSCSNDASYRFTSAAQAAEMARTLADATFAYYYTEVLTGTCIGGSAGCATLVNFTAF